MIENELHRGLDISDEQDGVLTVDLRRIIDALGMENVSRLHWRLFSLWAVGVLPGPQTVLDYEEMAETSPCGAPLRWTEVLLLADSTDQIIDAVFAAFESVPNVALKPDKLLKHATLVVEAHDSTYWRVNSRIPGHVESIRAAFREVRDARESPAPEAKSLPCPAKSLPRSSS